MADADEVEEFLSDKGTIEIFCVIGDSGARFSEINDKVSLSHDTISKRLKRGQYIDVFDPTALSGERGTTHKWGLDHAGRRFWEQLDEESVVETFDQLVLQRERFDDKVEDIQSWLQDSDMDLETEWVTGNLNQQLGETYEFDESDHPEVDDVAGDDPTGEE